MEKQLTVLLIEDDAASCTEFVEYINSVDDVTLIAVTNSSYKGIQHVKDYMPDAVILDLELHRGAGSGLLFLKELRNINISKSPYILVTTHNVGSDIINL